MPRRATQGTRALPFKLSRDEADKEFDKFHNGVFTSAGDLRRLGVDESFLPFWLVKLKVSTRIVSANLGFSYTETAYDSRRKTFVRERHMRWETHYFDTPFRVTEVDSTNPESQIYASYQYRREYVSGIRHPSIATEAVPFQPQMVEKPDGGVRRVEPFTMRQAVAIGRAWTSMRGVEEEAVVQHLKRTYGADEIRVLVLDIEPLEKRADPVYVPCYIYHLEYHDEIFRTFVNAATGTVGGQAVYATSRVAAAVGLGLLGVGAVLGGFSGGIVFWWFLLPFIIAMALFRRLPVLQAKYYEARRRMEEQAEGWAENETEWNTTGKTRQEDYSRTAGGGSRGNPFEQWNEAYRRANEPNQRREQR
ncbi:hypothetical protein HK104_005161, partial [Borealophlyctis nickersoniae]